MRPAVEEDEGSEKRHSVTRWWELGRVEAAQSTPV